MMIWMINKDQFKYAFTIGFFLTILVFSGALKLFKNMIYNTFYLFFFSNHLPY